MSEGLAPLRCDLSWDKLAPGRLRYQLGPVQLLQSGVMYNGNSKAWIPKGQCLILMRRLMLRFPYYCEYESLIDAIYPDPDTMPDYHQSVMKSQVSRIRGIIPRVGLRIVTAYSYGWKIEFIPKWEAL